MTRAEDKDRQLVVDILSRSFADNKSVNYIIKQDGRREQRLRKLMEYSFDRCRLFGEVFLSEDGNGCALIEFPDKKRTTLKSVLLDIKLITLSVGIANVKKVLVRDSKINRLRPATLIYYLWFVGVKSGHQNKGIGTKLLNHVIHEADSMNRPIYLETSTLKNIPWYQKFGFEMYNEVDLGYKLYFLKRAQATCAYIKK